MKIVTIQTGDMYVNCYLVFNEDVKQAVAIDPGGSEDKIFHELKKNGLALTHILLTHGHFDHIGAVKALREATGALLCIHRDDAVMLPDPYKNLSVFIDQAVIAPSADMLLEDGQTLTTGGMEIKVLHTPGHSEGSVCFIIEDALFSGDTLFYMSVGRTDFPDSSTEKLCHSVNHILKPLTKDYKVYPGHGISSTLNDEKRKNPFFERD